MKRLLCIIILLLLLTTSCAIDPPIYCFDYNELINDVMEVSFIRYYEQIPRKTQKGETPGIEVDLNMECLEIVCTLDESLKNEFLKDLSEVDFFYPYTYPYGYCDRPYGQGIQLKFNDGTFILFTMDTNTEREKDLRWLAMIDKYDEFGTYICKVADYRSASSFIIVLKEYFGDYYGIKHLEN